MPSVTVHSTQEGVYSAISPRGEGMKPGITKPIPFSIQIATNSSKQVGYNTRGLCRNG